MCTHTYSYLTYYLPTSRLLGMRMGICEYVLISICIWRISKNNQKHTKPIAEDLYTITYMMLLVMSIYTSSPNLCYLKRKTTQADYVVVGCYTQHIQPHTQYVFFLLSDNFKPNSSEISYSWH